MKASSLVGEYAKANEASAPSVSCSAGAVSSWSPPSLGLVKVNSDASCFADNVVGFGAVVRDCMGKVLMATCCLKVGTYEIEVAEAMAARNALCMALDASFSHSVLELDCANLYHKLRKNLKVKSAAGAIIEDIRKLASYCSSFSLCLVGRNGNEVAHTLANSSRNFTVLQVWTDVVPPFVECAVTLDVP